MNNITKYKLAWKYRKYLRKYRKLLKHRRAIAGVAAGAVAIAAGVWLNHRRLEIAAGVRAESPAPRMDVSAPRG